MSKRTRGHLLMVMPVLLLAFGVIAPPAASAAGELVACQVQQGDDSVRIEIQAKGEWSHRSFRVDDPERFVLDLIGVEVGRVSPRIEAGERFVSAVRTSQYRGGDEPVARVVLDLVEGARVSVDRTATGLALVAYGSTAPTDAVAAERWTDAGEAVAAESVVWEPAVDQWPAEDAGADHWQGEGVGRIAEGESEDTSYARTMSINMQNADIRTVLRAIADFSGRNIISSPDVKGTVTVAVTDLPWRQAMNAILRANGFGYVDEDGIIRVDTTERLREEAMAEKAAAQRVAELEPLTTKIVEVDYANADEVRESIVPILSTRGKVETDTRTNSLVVTDRAAIVERVASLARELDTRTPQVHIDALMVDLDSRRTRELGVDWYGSTIGPDATHETPFEGLAPSDVEIGGGVTRPLTDVAGRVNVGIIDDWGTVRADIQALAVKNLANIVSNPRITTTDNREASILVGQKIPLITQDVAGNAMTQLETIGIRLVVTPHINSDRQITLDVHPEVSDLSSQATVQGGVIINTSEADTRVLVANGETAVIAGLIRNLVSDFDSGVPFLKDIPLLGNLFKSSNKIKQQRELVVFLTPQIVEADDSMGTDRDWQIREEIKEAVENGHASVMK